MSKVRTFVPRAPRYEYQDDDDRGLRFSIIGDLPMEAHIHNLSLSGVAFFVPIKHAPKIGEKLKVELTLPLDFTQGKNPQKEKLAWYGRVARHEHKKRLPWWLVKDPKDYVIAGIHFTDMPVGHSQLIQKILDKRWEELRKQRWREHWRRAVAFYSKKTFFYFVYALACAGTFLFFKHFTAPSANYDPQRGAPWGHRFQFNYLFDKNN